MKKGVRDKGEDGHRLRCLDSMVTFRFRNHVDFHQHQSLTHGMGNDPAERVAEGLRNELL